MRWSLLFGYLNYLLQALIIFQGRLVYELTSNFGLFGIIGSTVLILRSWFAGLEIHWADLCIVFRYKRVKLEALYHYLFLVYLGLGFAPFAGVCTSY